MRSPIVLAAVVCAAFSLPALAQQDVSPGRGSSPDKTASQGSDHGHKGKTPGTAKRDQDRTAPTQTARAPAERSHRVIQPDYRQQVATGNCPPGLASKNNGCMPPGQAKKL